MPNQDTPDDLPEEGAESGETDPTVQWMRDAAQGDAKAWDNLFRRYRGPLSMAIRKAGVPKNLRGRFDTEDVLQSSFITAYNKIGEAQFVNEASFRAWINEIAINTLRDLIRHHQRDKRGAQREASPPTEVLNAHPMRETPSMFLSDKESNSQLLSALETLPEEDSSLVFWKTVERFSWPEVAAFLSCSERTARRRYGEIIRKLGSLLSDS